MSSLVVSLIVLAIFVFWALGAYNRLVQLRAQLAQALQQLVQVYAQQARAVQEALAEFLQAHPASSQWMALDEPSTRWRKLSVAAQQLGSCLGALHVKPHQLPVIDDLSSAIAARDIFENAWRTASTAQEDLAGAAAPTELMQRWLQYEHLVVAKEAAHRDSLSQYHQAITQFPAVLLSKLFGFQMSIGLRG